MATKTFYVTRDMKSPSYPTRMLKAGDTVDLNGPQARLYRALGAISEAKPRVARAPVEEAAEPAKPARKRTTRRKK